MQEMPNPKFGMGALMEDAIHIQIETIIFLSIRVWFGTIDSLTLCVYK